MPDIVTPIKRSSMMSGIRSKDTHPEMIVRKALHSRGFRYRLHVKDLPGKPDMVLPKYRAVIFIHGCFWHKHSCHLFKWPSTRRSFWEAKINANAIRDEAHNSVLLGLGWKVIVVWECALKGRLKLDKKCVADSIIDALYDTKHHFFQFTGY